jgi:hypothetical protein
MQIRSITSHLLLLITATRTALGFLGQHSRTRFVSVAARDKNNDPRNYPSVRANTWTVRLGQESSSASRSDNGTGVERSKKKSEEELTVPMIADMVDGTFVKGCMELAAGYIDVLKLFIVAVQSAYVQGIPPAVLIAEIDALTKPAAGRALMPEELRLRNTWIQVVYVMLAEINYKSSGTTIELDNEVRETYAKIAPIVIRRRSLSNDFNGKELLATLKSFFPGDLNVPLEQAVALQSLRVMWVTLTVVEEVERCEGEFAKMDAEMPPTPPIPGAFE